MAVLTLSNADERATDGCAAGTGAPTDEALMLRLRHADEAALAELHARHADACRALATRVLGDGVDAEDVVQDVFLTLWNRPERFDPDRGTGRAWLLSVVRHRAVDRLRRRHHQPHHDVTEMTDRLADRQAPSAFEEIYASVRLASIQQAMERLPSEQRSLIVRTYFQGQTHQEIASTTGLPLGTVKGRIRLGLQKLGCSLAEFSGDVSAPRVALAGA